ncbi:MBL fold metallo-hydrolase [Streptomyces sp. NPDC020965]|uniref:MBL fold metallo-hydrolase n=1 Tax=Streptomyces sp. NPDC020965 TaxID=3365105 RepID=UPI0037BB523D
MPEGVPGQHVRTAAEHERRDAVDGAEQVACFVGEPLGPWAARPGRVAGGPGEPVEVLALMAVEQRSAGDRVECLGRCPAGLALFQPCVVRDADARQLVPNATYLMTRRDFDFWDPANENRTVLGRGNQNVFEDSVAPVHRAGLTHLWEGTYRIDKNLCLDLAPGHAPGSSVLTLESGGDRALFVGDLVRTTLQIAEPDINSCFCEDPAESRATRRKLLGRAAEDNALVFPAHFGGRGAAEVARSGSKFTIKEWAGFSRIS